MKCPAFLLPGLLMAATSAFAADAPGSRQARSGQRPGHLRRRCARHATRSTDRAAARRTRSCRASIPNTSPSSSIEYKTGKRDNPIMKGFAAALSDADIKNVAAFYASKQARAGFAKDKELVTLGEKIYRGGITERQIPACSGCHSPTGAGIPSQYPRVSGQHADYTEAQLVAFRAGTRNNNAQMTGVAAKMNDREIKAVSDYIGGLR